jgi:hypothetical protein
LFSFSDFKAEPCLVLALTLRATAADDAQTSLKHFGEFMVGNWSPADQKDATEPPKHVYAWTMNNRFIRMHTERDPESWEGFFGVDPATNTLASWGFGGDGTVLQSHLVRSTDKQWVFEGVVAGPNGKTRGRLTIDKTADTALTAKIEDIGDGKTTVLSEEKWTRHQRQRGQ